MVSKERSERYGCARAKETGLCPNKQTVAAPLVEERLFSGLREHLVQPDYLEGYVRGYVRRMRELRQEAIDVSTAARAEVAKLTQEESDLVDKVIATPKGPALTAVMTRLDDVARRKLAAEAKLAETPPADNVVDLSKVTEVAMRRNLDKLSAVLASDPAQEAQMVLRRLIDRVDFVPGG